jgi:ubiquinone/menaquinone biosynthesis C-methylase UbiE
MPEDTTATLFFEMFSGLPRQGPGEPTSTLRALAFVPGVGHHTRVLDIGCGTGTHTRIVAQRTAAYIVAIDNHAPFLAELQRQAQFLGIGNRIETRSADMRRLEFTPGSFDVIWCEGAIYVVGFEEGLREWRRLLAPGGHMAITEVCWTKADPPRECMDFWAQEYPAIREVSVRLNTIAECGYGMVGHFTLPPSSWWDDYYRPLQQNIIQFRKRHAGDADAQQLADQVQREIDIWHAYQDFFSYEFFVIRAR